MDTKQSNNENSNKNQLEEDIRGNVLKINHFELQLRQLMANSNVDVGTLYFVLKDITNELEKAYNEVAALQYKDFSEKTRQTMNSEKEGTDK